MKPSGRIHSHPEERGQGRAGKGPTTHEPFPLSWNTPHPLKILFISLPGVVRKCLQRRGQKKEYQQLHSILHWGINYLLLLKINIMSNTYFYIGTLALYQISLSLFLSLSLSLSLSLPLHASVYLPKDKMSDIGYRLSPTREASPLLRGFWLSMVPTGCEVSILHTRCSAAYGPYRNPVIPVCFLILGTFLLWQQF